MTIIHLLTRHENNTRSGPADKGNIFWLQIRKGRQVRVAGATSVHHRRLPLDDLTVAHQGVRSSAIARLSTRAPALAASTDGYR
jgi:hypothetical protein